MVAESRVAGAAPTPRGGLVVSGVYYRTATVIYTGPGGMAGPSGRWSRQTLRITTTSSSTATLEEIQVDFDKPERRSASTLTLSGTGFQLDRTCPSVASRSFGYSFSGDTLEVFEPHEEGLRVITFVLQPGSSGGDGGVPGACSEVENLGPLVDQVRVASSAPAPGAGALSSGTFVRIADQLYTGPGGASGVSGKQLRQTLEIAATSASTGTIREYYEDIGDTPERKAYTFSTRGASLDLSRTCPGPGGKSLTYTLSGDDLIVFEPDTGGTRVSTFRRLGADGGIPGGDGGTPDAGIETIATGLTDLVDLELDGTDVYVLGNGEVRRCALAGCGTGAVRVTTTFPFASSLAIDRGMLWVTTDFRRVSSCDVSSGSCTLVQQVDLGANSYPVHLWVANGHVYWVSDSGASRLIQTCPSTGCGAGYPKTVFNGNALDGVPVSGLVVNATDAYVLSYVGGIFRIPLTSAETSDATAAVRTVGTGYGSGGFEGDASLLRWANINAGTLESCELPDCTRVDTPVSGLVTPVGIRSNATHVYGASRGTPNGSGGHVAGTASIWRMPR
ncbi:hypothetical protein Q664_31025 [Archangium violaceum Cb vi76]|uniref:Uncharacterized protein n=1 Tax=Archangium violaceum Cb vi76 TaxID=1406225 RepID=A0A084SNI4_9BACT|nr:hypothetical protein Q664_31025 [Archangium violaceum Cb vi76]